MIVGIDLGTTNSTVCTEEGPVPIRQKLAVDLIGESSTLPSFCFLPPEGGEAIVGHFAKERGAQVPDRVVHSAKSWLSHEGAERRTPFLPLGDCEEKISPVSACAKYLNHLKGCVENIDSLVVTVPASFDPSARQLVEEACDEAGLPSRILLEEPLAAFYAWLGEHEASWRDHLSVGDTVLVVDIGGGTTDFSLIKVTDHEGSVALERVAVGDHLLLGGDNMDLTLAYRLSQDHQLDDWQMGALVHGCRAAKEKLLVTGGSEEIVIPGRGSSLIGGTVTVTLTAEQVQEILLEGFFPLLPFDSELQHQPRSGLSEQTLPYARDPRITAHLAHFLKEQPTAVLFNGGVVHAPAIRNRLLEQLAQWKGEVVQELEGADFDLAVSRGAVYYGQVQQSGGVRVRAPLPHSYFIGVEKAAPAIPGMAPPVEGVCLVPKGMEEGSEVVLPQTFTLCVGEPVHFRFFSSAEGHGVGERHAIRHLTELHPIETTLDGEGVVKVQLKACVTELGVLELWCLSESGQQWRLEFLLREAPSLASSSAIG